MNTTLEQHPSALFHPATPANVGRAPRPESIAAARLGAPPRAPALGRIAIALVTGWDIAEVPVELPAELAEFEARLRIVGGPAGSRATSGARRRPNSSVRTARAGVHPC